MWWPSTIYMQQMQKWVIYFNSSIPIIFNTVGEKGPHWEKPDKKHEPSNKTRVIKNLTVTLIGKRCPSPTILLRHSFSAVWKELKDENAQNLLSTDRFAAFERKVSLLSFSKKEKSVFMCQQMVHLLKGVR